MAVAVTNTNISVLNTSTTITSNAATADTADLAEVFTITPTKKDGKVLVRIKVGPTNGSVAYSVAAGEFWMGIAAKTGSVAQNVNAGIVLESAKYKKKNGTIVITFTPASGKKLVTDHALAVEVIELP